MDTTFEEIAPQIDGSEVEGGGDEARCTEVGMFASMGFSGGLPSIGKNEVKSRWLDKPALIKMASGKWKVVVDVRQRRNSESMMVKFAASATTPSIQVKNEDEEWFLASTNVIKIVFGFVGGRFCSGGLTAEVRETVAFQGVLTKVRYAVFSQPEDEQDLGMADATVEDFFQEFAPEPVQMQMTDNGLKIVTSHEEARRSADAESEARTQGELDKDEAKMDLRSYGLELVIKVLEICKVLKPDWTLVHNTFAQKLFQSILGMDEISDDEAVLAQAGADVEAKLIAAGADVKVWEQLGHAQRSGLMKEGTATQVGLTVRRLVLHIFSAPEKRGRAEPREEEVNEVGHTERQAKRHQSKTPVTPARMRIGRALDEAGDSDDSGLDDTPTSSEDEAAPRRQKQAAATKPINVETGRDAQLKRKAGSGAQQGTLNELQQLTPKGMQPIEAARIFFNPCPTLLKAACIEAIIPTLAAHEVARFEMRSLLAVRRLDEKIGTSWRERYGQAKGRR